MSATNNAKPATSSSNMEKEDSKGKTSVNAASRKSRRGARRTSASAGELRLVESWSRDHSDHFLLVQLARRGSGRTGRARTRAVNEHMRSFTVPGQGEVPHPC